MVPYLYVCVSLSLLYFFLTFPFLLLYSKCPSPSFFTLIAFFIFVTLSVFWRVLTVFFFPPQGGKFPKFVSKEMEAMYIEELKASVNQLMANLESMPVSKGGEFKLQKLKRGHNTSIIDMGQEDENTLSKSDVVLSFNLEVLHSFSDGTNVNLCANRPNKLCKTRAYKSKLFYFSAPD